MNKEELKEAMQWLENSTHANSYGDDTDSHKAIDNLLTAAKKYIELLEVLEAWLEKFDKCTIPERNKDFVSLSAYWIPIKVKEMIDE